jgi:flagellar basal-body rod modification protein FlgD
MFAANAATSTSGSTNNDSQMFLQLMVAQMKYQDPMNPTDTSSMMAQNATFTEVQAIQEMQSEMGMVLSSQLAFGSAAMIGKNVSWIDANGVTQSGTVTGASFTSSGPVLSVGNQQIAMSDVASVGTVSSTPPASSTSTDTSGTNA